MSVLKEFSFVRWQENVTDREKVTWLVSAWLPNGERDRLFEELKKNQIDARPFFYPMSEMPLYKPYVFSAANSQKISKLGFNLPTINIEQINFEKVYDAFKNIS